jgi:hypothetical protein
LTTTLAIKRTDLKFWIIVGSATVFAGVAIWFLAILFEGEKPSIDLKWASPALGRTQTLTLTLKDKKSGLRRVWVGLLKDGREDVLLETKFPSASIFGRGEIHEKTIEVLVEPQKMGISDGKGILRIGVWDYAWRRILHGNRTYLEKEILVDTVAPNIDVLTRTHNINQGGAEVVIYKLTEDCPVSGVQVGDNFFPGHGGYFKDKQIHMAFFALSHTQGRDTRIFLKAADYAGNPVSAGFPYYIGKKHFRKDRINISEKFLKWKMPEFQKDMPDMANAPLVDQFLKVNRDFRKENYIAVTEVSKKSDERIYWRGSFLRLPRSARKASFADHRTYRYKGRTIDTQYHLGIDLASVAHSKVPAANSGKVSFAGSLGIYGKSVILDHGFGLMSMYAHLNEVSVKLGQIVDKGTILGRTGTTGLAGGDHLHFGILVHNIFVNPVEWWDPKWIKNNVKLKIDAVQAREQ